MTSAAEIKADLAAFSHRWAGYKGTERAEAQTFLNELFACYGSDRRSVGAEFEFFRASTGFMDLFWPETLIIEMKHPARPLQAADEQRNRYWIESADPGRGVAAARYVVACNFGEFEVWEPGRFPTQPRARFRLADLPERYEALLFLADGAADARFVERSKELTAGAARQVALMYESLVDRGTPKDEAQRFTMQAVWCLFAGSLGMLEGYPLRSVVLHLLAQDDPSEESAMRLGRLFALLNQKSDRNRVGLYTGTTYVNGELFAEPAEVTLVRGELESLAAASEYDWSQVDPTIFGSLMEGVLGQERRWELGAHYTHEEDILAIVEPTIVRPWRAQIDHADTLVQAVELLDQLCKYRVLDPACGCGNFLYVAYRELRALEHELKSRITELATRSGVAKPADLPYYPVTNLHGLDIEGASVLITKVTLWMGQRQLTDRFGLAEAPLPLAPLSGARQVDALTTAWPQVDAIIGNPPFLGSQHVRGTLGDRYVDFLKAEFGVGVKDLCVYWFRRAQDHLEPGQRAGLVGTNSVSQNRARGASLQYIADRGGVITDAVSSQKWPGDAKVHVSLVNWIKQPAEPVTELTLDGESVAGITTSLRPSCTDQDWTPRVLPANRGRCFQGPIPVGAGFIISEGEAKDLLGRDDVDYRDVVRPYLTSDDITDSSEQAPRRWVIDFASWPLERALRYPGALTIVRERVKPIRDTASDKGFRQKWWQFGRPRVPMRAALNGLERYISVGRHGKRVSLAWTDAWTMASDATCVFAFDDDYSMGILLSRAHDAWTWVRASTIKGDLRYTPTSVFQTFPFPDLVTEAEREDVAAASRHLYEVRSEICGREGRGLTAVYNSMDEGAYADLRAAHLSLDRVVADAYGWSRSIAQDSAELVRRLTDLNREITEGQREYVPFD